MRSVLPLALALTLSACGSDEAPAVDTVDAVVVETPATPEAPADPADAELDALLDEADAMIAEDPVAAEAAAPAPPPPPPAPEPAADLIAEDDARNGSIGDALLAGSWRIEKGPGETISFENDGTFQLYIGDRLVEGGEWTAEEGILYLGPTDAYVIDERRATGMTFSGPNGEMILEHIGE